MVGLINFHIISAHDLDLAIEITQTESALFSSPSILQVEKHLAEVTTSAYKQAYTVNSKV